MTLEELDQWAAERVMGWKIIETPRWGLWWSLTDDVDDREYRLGHWHPSDPNTGQIWMVVEKMRELGWSIQSYWGATSPYVDVTLRFIKSPTNLKTIKVSQDKEFCLAILKAAKAALEG